MRHRFDFGKNGQSHYVHRMNFVFDQAARGHLPSEYDERQLAWCFGYSMGLYFKDVEHQYDEAVARVNEHPEIRDAFREAFNAPSIARQILPPRPVGVGIDPDKVRVK